MQMHIQIVLSGLLIQLFDFHFHKRQLPSLTALINVLYLQLYL